MGKSIVDRAEIDYDQYDNITLVKVGDNSINIKYDFKKDIRDLVVIFNKTKYREITNYATNEIFYYEDNMGNLWQLEDEVTFPYETQRGVMLFNIIEQYFASKTDLQRADLFGFKTNKPMGPTKPI
tara:strand:+ start:7944 stop:8321 length:378 start_codon:yes stop_codon:yes gene_type:complete